LRRTNRVWACGYQPDYGHCLFALDEAPIGWGFFNDAYDFDPAIVLRDGFVWMATGENAGNTAARIYQVDPLGQRWRVNDGPWQTRIRIDVSVPPGPKPPDPKPPDPKPPDPKPPDPKPEPYPWGAIIMAFDPNQIRPLQHIGENALPNNRFSYNAPKNTPGYDENGEGAVLSIQENGKIECRPKGTAGAFESFAKDSKTGAVTVNNSGFNESGNYWTFVPNNVSGL